MQTQMARYLGVHNASSTRVCCFSVRRNKSQVLNLELLSISSKILNYTGIMNISQAKQLALRRHDSKSVENLYIYKARQFATRFGMLKLLNE
jgi:hypothetical protein